MGLVSSIAVTLDDKRYVRSVRLNPGQRYSVLVTAKSNHAASYWIRATVHSFVGFNGNYTTPAQPNVGAVLQYLPWNRSLILPSMDTFHNDAKAIHQSFVDGRPSPMNKVSCRSISLRIESLPVQQRKHSSSTVNSKRALHQDSISIMSRSCIRRTQLS